MPREKEPKKTAPTEMDKLKVSLQMDREQLRNRLNELTSVIPTLEREKQQIIGMIAMINKILDEGGADEQEGNRNEPNGTDKSGDGQEPGGV